MIQFTNQNTQQPIQFKLYENILTVLLDKRRVKLCLRKDRNDNNEKLKTISSKYPQTFFQLKQFYWMTLQLLKVFYVGPPRDDSF